MDAGVSVEARGVAREALGCAWSPERAQPSSAGVSAAAMTSVTSAHRYQVPEVPEEGRDCTRRVTEGPVFAVVGGLMQVVCGDLYASSKVTIGGHG